MPPLKALTRRRLGDNAEATGDLRQVFHKTSTRKSVASTWHQLGIDVKR